MADTQLSRQVQRLAWGFQAAIAAFLLLNCAWDTLIEYYNYDGAALYYFIAFTINSLISAAILFADIIQIQAKLNKSITLHCEYAKSLLVTVMWLWSVLDTALGPWKWRSRYQRPSHSTVVYRTLRSASVIMVVIVMFYLPAIYVHRLQREGDASDEEEASGPGTSEGVEGGTTETSPLLA